MMSLTTNVQVKCQSCFAPLRLETQRNLFVTCHFCGTENILPHKLQTVTQVNSRRFSSILYRFIAEEFDMTGIQDLVMQLNGRMVHSSLDFEDLSGQNKKAKAQELVKWCQRYDELETLISIVKRGTAVLRLVYYFFFVGLGDKDMM